MDKKQSARHSMHSRRNQLSSCHEVALPRDPAAVPFQGHAKKQRRISKEAPPPPPRFDQLGSPFFTLHLSVLEHERLFTIPSASFVGRKYTFSSVRFSIGSSGRPMSKPASPAPVAVDVGDAESFHDGRAIIGRVWSRGFTPGWGRPCSSSWRDHDGDLTVFHRECS